MDGRSIKTGLAALLAMAASGFGAAEVSVEEAKRAVENWLRDDPTLGCGLRSGVAAARTCVTKGGARFHVARLEKGGFVVTTADTALEPVVAFSESDDLVESEENPLWVLLVQDMEARAKAVQDNAGGTGLRLNAATRSPAERKWARLLGTDGGNRLRASAPTSRSSVSDVRVAPFVKSHWGQTTVNGMSNGKSCYDLCTPKNYSCGCVATTGAQIMRYFEWPKTALAQVSNPYCQVDGVRQQLTTQGGTFDWANMPLTTGQDTTDAQCRAIGKLLADIGICCGMQYAKAGSAVGGYMLAPTLIAFGYANALAYQTYRSSVPLDVMRRAFISNLDAKLPVAISFMDTATGVGHSVVGDGYGYSDGTLYYHFNVGWLGISDAWYAPPNVEFNGNAFDSLDGFVYNIFTDAAWRGATICSGRVLNQTGNPVAGATVEALANGIRVQTVTTDDNGIYALVLPAGETHPISYVLKAKHLGSEVVDSVALKKCVGTETTESGSFYLNDPEVNNICDHDLTLSGLVCVEPPVFTPEPGLFHPSVSVTLASATDGADIRYTLDGSAPTETSMKYAGAITLTTTTTIRAQAFRSGMSPSVIVAATYVYDTKQDAPEGDYYDNPIEISGASGSFDIDDTSRYTLETGEPYHSLVSGSYYYEARSAWFRWTAPGSGKMTFSAASEFLDYEAYMLYHLGAITAAYVGTEMNTAKRVAVFDTRDGRTGATSMTFDVQQGQEYRIVVTAFAGGDMIGSYHLEWKGDLIVSADETTNTPVPVPYAWLGTHYPGATDYGALALSNGANGRPVWQSYLLGLVPTEATSDLRITSLKIVDGRPEIGWNVTNENIRSFGYDYRIRGRSQLNAGEWLDVKDGHRYFKVVVEKIKQ